MLCLILGALIVTILGLLFMAGAHKLNQGSTNEEEDF